MRLVVPNSGNLDIQVRSAGGTLGSQNIDVTQYEEVYLEAMIRVSIAPDSAALGASYEERAALDEAAAVLRSSPKADGGSWNIVRIPMSFAIRPPP